MSLSTSHFTIEQLESRYEMQYVGREVCDINCDGGGAAYDYYGTSWGNMGSGDGYTGVYQGDGSGNAQLDDGTYTDQSSGDFPAYNRSSNVSVRSFCRVCRCRF